MPFQGTDLVSLQVELEEAAILFGNSGQKEVVERLPLHILLARGSSRRHQVQCGADIPFSPVGTGSQPSHELTLPREVRRM